VKSSKNGAVAFMGGDCWVFNRRRIAGRGRQYVPTPHP